MRRVTSILCTVLVLSACSEQPAQAINGYVEGDSVIVSAPQGGWITSLAASRGQTVKVGDALFSLDADAQIADRDRAEAAVAQAQAVLDNLGKGRRPEELAAFEAGIAEAEAAARFAAEDLARQQALLAKGFTTRRAVQSVQSSYDAARARFANARSQLSSAKLGGRSDDKRAAESAVAAARAQLASAEYALAQRQVRARVAGVVQDVLREAGEFAPANGAVVQILPPDAIKLKFFVPESQRNRVALGMSVSFTCSACPPGLTARVSFISPSAEFTPPVIYSESAREKLVWAVEARPNLAQVRLSPGQVVDIRLGGAPQS